MNESLLSLVRSDGPATVEEFFNDCRILRYACKRPDLPKDAGELLEQMLELEQAGSVRLTEKGWEAVYAERKPEPTERRLFA
jgi:hypothetical protein